VHLAVSSGSALMTRLILQHGGDPEYTLHGGYTNPSWGWIKATPLDLAARVRLDKPVVATKPQPIEPAKPKGDPNELTDTKHHTQGLNQVFGPGAGGGGQHGEGVGFFDEIALFALVVQHADRDVAQVAVEHKHEGFGSAGF